MLTGSATTLDELSEVLETLSETENGEQEKLVWNPKETEGTTPRVKTQPVPGENNLKLVELGAALNSIPVTEDSAELDEKIISLQKVLRHLENQLVSLSTS